MTKAQRAEYSRSRRLLIKYGITAREYDAILRHQAGGCAICGAPPKKTRLAVEHRHRDGLTRGLVCWQDNKAIAYLRDDPARAGALVEFLLRPPAAAAIGREVYGRSGRSTRRWRTKREKRERMAQLEKSLKAEKAYYEKM